MTDSATPSALHLKENLKGRIDNLSMSPSYANTLIPVFEALMNSIHSVQERFGDEWFTPFFCYLVCDITPKLKATLEDYGVTQMLPGGVGTLDSMSLAGLMWRFSSTVSS